MSTEKISAVIIADTPLNIEELAEAVQCHPDFIIELVEHSIVSPTGSEHSSWRFDQIAFVRVKRAVSFYHDLEINVAGVALALDLLDQIDELKQHLATLEHHVE